MTIVPQCFRCRHFIDDRRFTCGAFPDGIPDPILVGEHDHREPYKGDHGIRFEPTAMPKEPEKE